MRCGKKIFNKKTLQVLVLLLCCGLTVWGGSSNMSPGKNADIPEEKIPLSDETGRSRLISQTEADIDVIPDQYNCGAKNFLTTVIAGETINGVKFKESNGKNVMEFGYGNQNISGTVIFENMDFSGNEMGFYNEDRVDRNIKVVFNNCKFSKIKTSETASRMQYEFNNCTIKSFYGCNATFERCLFGESYQDGIIPFQNVTVNNCYVKDMSSTDPASTGIHSDGTQMFGHKNAEVKNVYFNNCRFEVPAIQTGGNSASVNACIMVQLEYNNAQNIQFSKCKINGGGYSIYARATKPELTLNNVVFSNVEVGCAKLFKTVYTDVSPAVRFENLKDTDSLYIGSVWKEAGTTHLSVSNDTNVDRSLVIYTDRGNYNFVVPKCPDGKNLYSNFKDYPFDIDVVIRDNCNYVVAYDTTEGGKKQIRFVNWSNQQVYLEDDFIDIYEPDRNVPGENGNNMSGVTIDTTTQLLAGTCGDSIMFWLDEDGILHMKGRGAAYNYHSKNPAPWYEYRDKIYEVDIADGITVIGNQCFGDCKNLKKVKLPDTLIRIGGNAFIRCRQLKEIVIPENIREIADYAFAATSLNKSDYLGSEERWGTVFIGKKNEQLIHCINFEY